MNTAIVLETFVNADGYLSRQPMMYRVDWGADDGRETRIDENLATYDNKHTGPPWIPWAGRDTTLLVSPFHLIG